jgi:hypothetical protein
VPNSASGIGSIQGISEFRSGRIVGSLLAPTRPAGSARLPRCSSAVRQALVAMRYSQVRSEARCSSNRSAARQARTIVSWTRSSASWTEPSIR